jgi:glycosyltransferase involved in cell wall biosynthesis
VRRNLLSEGYSPEKIRVIRNGIAIPQAEPDCGRLRRDLELPETGPLVALISRLNPLKGIEYFLAAAARVAAEFDDACFLVVGDGIDLAYRERLEDFTARLGMARRVIFTGFRLDVPSVLGGVSVSVLPSLSEGLSNVLLESMAAGLPVVATRVGGNPEIVQDGVTGLLVPPRDDAAMADAICRVLRNPAMAARLGAAGKRRVLEQFSIERLVAETQRLYMNLLTAASGRSRIQEVASA